MNLYATADRINQPSHGGGQVTWHELQALLSLENVVEWFDREKFQQWKGELPQGAESTDPWIWDTLLKRQRDWTVTCPKLCHFYAGTFSRSVDMFHRFGCPVTYTAAAHSIEESKREHNELGIPYNYPHLTDPALWNRYVQGYLDADVLVCPSHHSAEVMRGFGARNRIEVIPHGCRIPEEVHPLPRTFTVGYLGAAGPDKGLRYLFAAWKKLNYRDAVLKIGGRDSTTGYMQQLWNAFGGGNVQFCGWQENAEDFYGSLSCYVQPSVSEGFGMEVIEAMACGRNVICSKGAGASDAVSSLWIYDARNVDRLAYLINDFKEHGHEVRWGHLNRETAKEYSWDKIRTKYATMWNNLLGNPTPN